MARLNWLVIAVALGWSALPGAARPGPTSEEGSRGWSGDSLFKTYCATCHGPTAKGDGPLADHLRFRPPDLTLFAKRNGGKFAADKVERIARVHQPARDGADLAQQRAIPFLRGVVVLHAIPDQLKSLRQDLDFAEQVRERGIESALPHRVGGEVVVEPSDHERFGQQQRVQHVEQDVALLATRACG